MSAHLIASLALTGCDRRLNEVRVIGVAIVDPAEIPGRLRYSAERLGTPQLRLTLVARVDLASLNGQSVMEGGACPWKHGDSRQLYSELYEDGRPTVYRGAPARRGPAFTYEAYVPVAGSTVVEHKSDGFTELTRGPVYDLVADRRDLCLQIAAPAMLGSGRSKTFVVPALAIARAAAAKRLAAEPMP